MNNGIAIEQQVEDMHNAIAASNRHSVRLQNQVQELALLINELNNKIELLTAAKDTGTHNAVVTGILY